MKSCRGRRISPPLHRTAAPPVSGNDVTRGELETWATESMETTMKREVPTEILRNLQSWKIMAILLRVTFVFLGSVATVAGLVVTTFNGEIGTWWTKIFALSAAAALGLLTAFDISGKANAVRKAWRNLNAAAILYREDPTYSFAELLKEYKKGEDLVGDVNYIPQKTDEGKGATDKTETPTELSANGNRTPVVREPDKVTVDAG
jgi:hypothetical protein